ncbi:MAG: Invertebrate iridescent virus 6 [Bacteroidota bacterium]|jgi:hypothetical protein
MKRKALKVKTSSVFTLKNINTDEIHSKYNIKHSSTGSVDLQDAPRSNVTLVSELHQDNSTINLVRNQLNVTISMIDSITKKELQRTNCFWCRHNFTTLPIGCPIQYVHDKAIKQCQSEITKEQYTIVQKIASSVEEIKDSEVKHIRSGHYVVDGCFCSFNCCLAFINDNLHNSMYSRSKYLLVRLYCEMFSTDNATFQPAPSYRLLDVYGGHLTIKEFRSSFTTHVYTFIGCVTSIPKMYPVGFKYEEQIII